MFLSVFGCLSGRDLADKVTKCKHSGEGWHEGNGKEERKLWSFRRGCKDRVRCGFGLFLFFGRMVLRGSWMVII